MTSSRSNPPNIHVLKLVSIAAFLSLDFCPSYHKRRRLTSDALEKAALTDAFRPALYFL